MLEPKPGRRSIMRGKRKKMRKAIRSAGLFATWTGMFIVEFNDGSGEWWTLGVACGFFTAWAVFSPTNSRDEEPGGSIGENA